MIAPLIEWECVDELSGDYIIHQNYYVGYNSRDHKYAHHEDSTYYWGDATTLFLTYAQVCNRQFDPALELMFMSSGLNSMYVPVEVFEMRERIIRRDPASEVIHVHFIPDFTRMVSAGFEESKFWE